MEFVKAFLVGGLFCAVGQVLIDRTNWTPARILTGYVVAGVILSAFGWYGKLVEFAGAGATVPLTGFGHLLVQGVVAAVEETGLIGVLGGGLAAASVGIAASVVCGFLVACLFRPHEKR